MMRTVERIEQELARLDQSVAAIAQEFHDTYRHYLTALGQAVQQQLVVASYHLCTHAYPERFLKLSLAQRQQLQQSLRQLAKAAQPQFLQLLQTAHVSAKSPRASTISSSVASLLDMTDLAILQEIDDEVEKEIERVRNQLTPPPLNQEAPGAAAIESSEATNSSLEALPDWLDAIESIAPDQINPASSDLASPESPEPHSLEANPSEATDVSEPAEAAEASSSALDSKPTLPTTPKDLLQWQEQLEAGIVETLQTLSHSANRLLQQSEVLSGRLPEPVLEVASKADLATEATVSPPNLLHLLIETDSEDDKEPTMTQLMAIRLRLSEIEFSDSPTTVWRSKIRDLSNQLTKLGRDYQKKQKERSIAEAEAAWRSSWFED